MARSTAQKHIDNTTMFKEHIDSIISDVRFFNRTHQELLAEISERVWGDPIYQKLPAYYLGQLRGHFDCLTTLIERNDLDWQLFDTQTQQYVQSKDWAEWRNEDGTPRINGGRHVWHNTDNPY